MSITWLWQCLTEHLLEWRPDDLEAVHERLNAPILIHGGSTRLWISYSSMPLHALIAVFRPNALHQLVGLEPTAWLNQVQPLAAAKWLSNWLEWVQKILAMKGNSSVVPLLYSELE